MPLSGLIGGLLFSNPRPTMGLMACHAAYFLVTPVPAVDRNWHRASQHIMTESVVKLRVALRPLSASQHQ